jgi:hypothetical protein
MNAERIEPSSPLNPVPAPLLAPFFALFLALLFPSCGPKEIRPADLFPEDQCASCRMAVSDGAFASQILYDDGSAAKFDDLRCFDNYRKAHPSEEFVEMFVADYETKEWIPYGRSVIVLTGIETPMGSGRIAVGGQEAAKRLKEQYPPKMASAEADACCEKPGH